MESNRLRTFGVPKCEENCPHDLHWIWKESRVIVIRSVYTQRNLIKSNRNQIVFTICRLIWNQTGVRLVPNQSKNGKYNLISDLFNKISKKKFSAFTSLVCQIGKNWTIGKNSANLGMIRLGTSERSDGANAKLPWEARDLDSVQLCQCSPKI